MKIDETFIPTNSFIYWLVFEKQEDTEVTLSAECMWALTKQIYIDSSTVKCSKNYSVFISQIEADLKERTTQNPLECCVCDNIFFL